MVVRLLVVGGSVAANVSPPRLEIPKALCRRQEFGSPLEGTQIGIISLA